MSCLFALIDGSVPGWDPIEESPQSCLAAEVEVAGRLSRTTPDPGISDAIELTRGRAQLALADGPLQAAIRTAAVRSAGDQGYLGIDGEAYVPEVDGAVVGLQSARYRVHGELGIVPDLWIEGSDRAWGLSGTLPTLGAAAGWMERADVGARGGVVLPWHLGSADLAITTGEGFATRERNEGKDTSFAVNVDPLGRTAHEQALVFSIYGREGTRGLAYADDSRLGVRVAGELPRVGYGAEVLKAWGVDADETRQPLGESAWAHGEPWGPLYAVGRVDRWVDGQAAAWEGLGAIGARVDRDDSRIVLLAGVSRADLGGLAPIAGALEAGTTWFVQLDGRLVTSTPE